MLESILFVADREIANDLFNLYSIFLFVVCRKASRVLTTLYPKVLLRPFGDLAPPFVALLDRLEFKTPI